RGPLRIRRVARCRGVSPRARRPRDGGDAGADGRAQSQARARRVRADERRREKGEVTMRARTNVIAPLVVALAVTSAAPVSHAAYHIRNFVIGNGATPATGITGSGRKNYGTAGQAAVGVSEGSALDLCHGFWCNAGSTLVTVEPPPGGIEGTLPKTLGFG